MAFHPRYAKNRRFYVNYTDTGGDTRVVEFRSNGRRALLGTARQLLFVEQPYSNHNGGQLQFGPDGMLYVGMGDGGAGGDPHNNGQTPTVRLAKLLRTNPLAVDWKVAGYGLRNPWRFSFDHRTGDLYIADVGQNSREEIDFRPKGAPPANYGWARYEGSQTYSSEELDVKAVVSRVVLGEADAGIVYVTDVKAAGDEAQGIAIPESSNVVGRYPISVLKDAPNREAADAFVAYVLSPAGRATLEKAGFLAP